MAGTLRKIKAGISRPATASFPRRRESIILKRNEAKACAPPSEYPLRLPLQQFQQHRPQRRLAVVRVRITNPDHGPDCTHHA